MNSIFGRVNNRNKERLSKSKQKKSSQKESNLRLENKFSNKKTVKLPFIKTKLPIQALFGLIVILLLVVGSISATFLTQINQDVRQQASMIADDPGYCGGVVCDEDEKCDSATNTCVSDESGNDSDGEVILDGDLCEKDICITWY